VNLTQFNRILRQAFLLPVIALLLTAAALYLQIHNSIETVQLIQQTDARIAQAALVAKLIVDEESGLRGYQTTADDRFLTSFHEAENRLPLEFNKLVTVATLDAVQQHNIEDVRNDYQNWHDAFALPIIATVRAGGQANDVNLNLYGKTPTVIFGPGSTAVMHADDEWVAIDDYRTAIKVMALSIHDWCNAERG